MPLVPLVYQYLLRETSLSGVTTPSDICPQQHLITHPIFANVNNSQGGIQKKGVIFNRVHRG